ncbi:hypothetical protein JL722_2395 [Aureococcus anophagefferens]|nr:hypothetical protein JL722_2395 [Aureococcus anophagefferens]
MRSTRRRPPRGPSAEPPHATLAGLPPPLAAQVLACLGARQVRRVAATARGPRVEASRDALWSRLLRRDRAALDVDVPPGDGSLGSGPVVAIYAALALAARAATSSAAARGLRVVGEEEETVARRRDLARALFDFDDADRPYRISPFSPPAPALEPTFAPAIPRGPTWAPPWAFR